VKVVVFKSDGVAYTITPSMESEIDDIAQRDVLSGCVYVIIESSDIPLDETRQSYLNSLFID
jgi:hypothetical protein